jgi:glycosyltransferase involved in cell wall biosynthesis
VNHVTKGRVAFLSHDGLTDPLGQSQILPYMIGMSKEGYSVTIFSFEKSNRFVKLRADIESVCRKYKIRWVSLPYHKSPPIMATMYDLYSLRREVERSHKAEAFDILHCRSYPTSLVGLWMKRKYGTRYIFDMRGYWADERVEGKLWNMRNPLYKIIYRYFKWKENQFLKGADYVVSLTDNSKKEILARNLRKGDIAVIPTCVDMQLFNPNRISEAAKAELRKKLGIGDEFVMFYLGSWSTWYLSDEMLSFFEGFKKLNPSAKLLIVSLEKIDISKLWYKDDVILTESPREQVPLYISIASASIFFIKPSFSKTGTYATKMGEIMAMNVPIITNSGWGDSETIVRAAGGFLNTDTDVYEKLLAGQEIDTRTYCQDHISLETGVRRYKKIYEQLLMQKSFQG